MSKTVLIADDRGEVRKATRKVVESIPGCVVCGEAVDGADAVQKARELEPDLVIMDLAMPHMNGFDAARALRITGSHVPIILFTGYDSLISPAQISYAGIDAVVPKMGFERLITQVQRLLAAV